MAEGRIQRRTFGIGLPLLINILFILVAPVENIYRTEQYVYVAGVAALGACLVLGRSFQLNASRYWLCFMIYAYIACLWSKNTGSYSSLLTMYAQLLFLILQLQFPYSREDYQKIKVAFLIQNWILISLCFRFGSIMDSRFWLKSALSGADPNYLSGWFIIPLCFAVEFLFSEQTKLWQKAIAAAQIAVSFYFIMQTASQSGLIANALAITLATIYSLRDTVHERPLRALLIAAIFIAGVVLAINHMPAYLLSRLSNRDMTFTGRTELWSEIMGRLLTNPLGLIFGHGTASVSLYTSSGMVSHNTFLDILFNQGVIGLTLLLVFMFSDLRDKWRSRPYAVIALLSMSVLIFTLSAFATRFVMLMFFLIGAEIYDEDDEEAEAETV